MAVTVTLLCGAGSLLGDSLVIAVTLLRGRCNFGDSDENSALWHR